MGKWFERWRRKRWLWLVKRAVAKVDTPNIDASSYEDWYV